ncbi:NAD(+)/NADH kinase [soil metagenome]
MRLGLVVHPSRPSAAEVAARLAFAAGERGWKVDTTGIGRWSGESFDVVVGVGGDGTLLEAAHLAHRADIPVAGVNLGTVGYLAEFDPDDLEGLLDTLLQRPLPEIGRMTLGASTADGSTWHAINDVVIEKVLSQRIVQLTVAIDGEHFTTYRADGIIVATPLGSTAYSLSAGGPVLDPGLEALVMTPVAPHSLLSRSLVLRPDTTVTFTVEGDRPVRVNLDGREATMLTGGESLTVHRGDRPVRFVSVGGRPFPQGVRRQFGLDHA